MCATIVCQRQGMASREDKISENNHKDRVDDTCSSDDQGDEYAKGHNLRGLIYLVRALVHGNGEIWQRIREMPIW